MATVPENQGQTVAASSGTLPLENINAPAAAFGTPIAQGLANVAGSVEKASDMLSQRAEQVQSLTNKANSDNAAITSNSAQDQSFIDFQSNVKGAVAAQRGPNGESPVFNNFVAKLNLARETARSQLNNPMAQALFDANTRRAQSGLEAEASRHIAAETNKYVTTSAMNLAQNAADTYAAHPGDPEMEQNMLQTVKQQARFLALHNGEDTPDTTGPDGVVTAGDHANSDLMQKKLLGATYTDVAKTMDDPNAALTFLKNREDLMDPKSYSLAVAQLQPKLKASDAATAADSIVASVVGGSHAPVAAANPQSYFSGLAGGNVTITSGARSAEHNAEVGGVQNSEHIPGNGTAFDMTPPPGMTTAQLVAKLKASIPDAHQILDEGDHVHVGWKAVPGSSVTSAAGGAQTSMELQGKMQTALSQADAYAQANHPGDVQYKDLLEQRTMANMNRQISAAKDVEYSAYSELAAPLVGGTVQDMATLLAQPGALDKWNSLPIPQRTALQAELKHNANDITPERFQTLSTLNGMQKDNPNLFQQQDIASMDLPTTQKLTLMKEQAAIRNRTATSDPDTRFLKQVQQMPEWKSAEHGLEIKPGSDDHYNLLGTFSGEKAAWEVAHPGAQPQVKDIQGMIARATAQNAQAQFIGGIRVPFSGTTNPSYEISDEDAATTKATLQQYNTNHPESAIPITPYTIARYHTMSRIKKGGQ